ncbi:MAG: ABC transporter permease [Caldisericia bacterium]|nr:ABC transporter permease [Caldisericia bacterium]
MRTLSDIWQICKKDLTEFPRDKMRLVVFLIMPIFMMILTGFIFPNQSSIKDIPIGIVNSDPKVGNQLKEALSNIEMTKGNKAFIVKEYKTVDQVKEAIKKQDVNGALIIPEDFSNVITSSKQAKITIIEDQSSPQISKTTTSVLSKVVEMFGQKIGSQKVETLLSRNSQSGKPDTSIQQMPTSGQSDASSYITPISVEVKGLIEGETNYFDFVAPGIIAMIVLTAVLTGLAASVSVEREHGTLDGILIAPISRLSIIMGKALSQSVRGLIQGALVLLLAMVLFGVHINGSLFLVTFILILGIFSFVGLGILVSASAAQQESAMQVLSMVQFPMLFLSGVFFPIQQMPAFMQVISKCVPLTYAVDALRKVMILGAGIGDVAKELVILVLFGAVTLIIAVPLFKKIITR